ncbi:MAG: NYN domain-containing protein [Planctomycetes bacterium]|nr:NYN domain-containing protein [Planctomycetota bacterium]
MKRVVAYIDGFNLYFGLKSKGWKRYFWLDVQKLVRNLLKDDQELVFTKYFTSMVSSTPQNPEKHKRQSDFLEALGTLGDFKIYFGQYQLRPQKCGRCGFVQYIPTEKMTDVNIATQLMTDAYENIYDMAMLVSADSDLTGPVEAVRTLFPAKRVVVAFPPDRVSKQLKLVASAYFTIGRDTIAHSQFPDEVRKPDGFILRRPLKWR